MSYPSRKRLALFVWMAIALYVTISCQSPSFLGDAKVAEMSSSEGYYTIAPATILESLAQGKTDVFTPQIATPEAITPTPAQPVQWSQADYFRIAQALHEFVWNESWDGWALDKLLFRLDCAEVSRGPQRAHFTFFRVIHTREQESRLERDLWIEPFTNSASWHEVEYYPNVLDAQGIDLSQIKIPVESALRIAEQNGGAAVRSEVEDACRIYLILAPGSKYNGWQVAYSGYDPKYNAPTNLFEIRIDPFTTGQN